MKIDRSCLGWILFYVVVTAALPLGVDYCSRHNKVEQQEAEAKLLKHRKDSIDSLSNTPEYRLWKDSIDKADEIEESIRERGTVVVYLEGDSLCHYSTDCFISYDDEWHRHIPPLGEIRIATEYQAKRKGMKLCKDCEEREEIYRDNLNGELVRIDDLFDYVKNNYDKNEVVEWFDK